MTDPHNLGACLRNADAAGVQAIIVPKDNAARLTATVRKVAVGAAESVPLVQVTNLSRTMKALQTTRGCGLSVQPAKPIPASTTSSWPAQWH